MSNVVREFSSAENKFSNRTSMSEGGAGSNTETPAQAAVTSTHTEKKFDSLGPQSTGADVASVDDQETDDVVEEEAACGAVTSGQPADAGTLASIDNDTIASSKASVLAFHHWGLPLHARGKLALRLLAQQHQHHHHHHEVASQDPQSAAPSVDDELVALMGHLQAMMRPAATTRHCNNALTALAEKQRNKSAYTSSDDVVFDASTAVADVDLSAWHVSAASSGPGRATSEFIPSEASRDILMCRCDSVSKMYVFVSRRHALQCDFRNIFDQSIQRQPSFTIFHIIPCRSGPAARPRGPVSPRDAAATATVLPVSQCAQSARFDFILLVFELAVERITAPLL